MASILVISKYYFPFSGGIEENVRHIAEYAAKSHDVTVIASNHEPGNSSETIAGVHVVRRNVDLLVKSQPISWNFLSGIDLSAYDVVHFHSPNPLVTAQFQLKQLFARKTPVVVTHHMDIYGRKLLRALSLPFLRKLIRDAHATIVTSQKNVAVSNDLPADGRYIAIPLSISAENYVIDDATRASGQAWRKSFSGDAPLVGFIGRHARYKGLTVLMDALATLPGVHAVIAGDGSYRAEAEAYCRQCGIEDRVKFVGRVSHEDKVKILSAIDVFAFPSTEITEAFGISQMEAMLCGAPMVASNLPTGVTDVSIDGETALLATPGDAGDLAKTLERMITDRALAGRLAENARQHVLQNMTHEIVCSRTLAVIEAAMADRAVPATDAEPLGSAQSGKARQE